MNELKIFESPEFGQVRTVVINNEPWFVGKDVAEILGFSNPRDAISCHVFQDDKGVDVIDTLGGRQQVTVINESGLYALVFGSRLDSAKKFKRWVTSEVLPTIRKHGMYATDELLNNPDLFIKVLQDLKAEREEKKALQAENARMKPKEIFADAVSASSTAILVGELAKILKQNGIEIGQKRLFEWLRDKGYLIKRKGSDWNSPTQYSMELGLFEVTERAIDNPDGSVRLTKTTKVTGKGQQYFINKFLNKLESA